MRACRKLTFVASLAVLSLVVLPLVSGAACVRAERPEEVRPLLTAPLPQPAPLTIEVWHDTVCPWCRIGAHHLARALEGWSGPPVEVVIHPFLLDPDLPPEGADLRARLARKYGNVVDSMFERVTQHGAAVGLRFAWEKVRISPNTARSHVLVEWAPAERKLDLLHRLHRAYFEEGRDIGSLEVLAAVVREAGLDEAAALDALADPTRLASVRERAAAASASGITGVPAFRIGSRRLSGAQPPEVLKAALLAAAEER